MQLQSMLSIYNVIKKYSSQQDDVICKLYSTAKRTRRGPNGTIVATGKDLSAIQIASAGLELNLESTRNADVNGNCAAMEQCENIVMSRVIDGLVVPNVVISSTVTKCFTVMVSP
jgi:hypothetical protein